jgi:ubiquinol-cytochrome c reductase cytochrome c1 subunit
MRKLFVAFALALTPLTGMTAGGPAVELESANIDLNNHESIQRGAKYVVNYCMGCHSTQYVRYKQMTKVGLTEDEIEDNLMFADDKKVGDLMTIAMPEQDSAKWFGAAPPDLTLTARIKPGGADWIYTYMKGFYTDPSRPLGVNNTVFANVGMPHVLWDLQGIQDPSTASRSAKTGTRSRPSTPRPRLWPSSISRATPITSWSGSWTGLSWSSPAS